MKGVKMLRLRCEKRSQAVLSLMLIFASLNLFSAYFSNVSAVPVSPYIAVVPERIIDPTMTIGTNFTVSLFTDYTGSDIYGWQFNLTFDPDVLHLYYHNKTDTWTGTGSQRAFFTTISPVVQDSEKVYVDNTLMTKGVNYNIDYTSGRIYFRTPAPPPGVGVEVKATYLYGIINGNLVTSAKSPIVFVQGEFDNIAGTLSGTVAVFDLTAVQLPPVPTTNGPGILANITFTVVGTGFSDLTLGAFTRLWGPPPPPDYQYAVPIIDIVTMPDHIGHGYFDNIQNIHDVATSKLVTLTTAISGNLVPINVTIRNEGNFTDSVDVTVYANATFVGMQTIDVARGAKATLTFEWDTTDVIAGNYIVNATASLTEDTDLSDNTKTGQIEIKSHNVAIISLQISTKATIGDPVPINVTVRNEGQIEENVTLTISYEETVANPQPVVISATNFILAEHLATKIVSVSWNTTGMFAGAYKINATAAIAIDDVPEDNTKTAIISLSPPTHDVAIIAVSATPHVVFVGEHANINVTVRNVGSFNEPIVELNVAYDSNIINSQSFSLLLGKSAVYSFIWDTTGIAPSTYSVTAEAILDGDATPENNIGVVAVDVKTPPPGHISGLVRDASTGNPIQGANVTTKGYFGISDANGRFNITNLPVGKYNVTASANGYKVSSKMDISVVSGQTTSLNFDLTLIPTTGHVSGIVRDASTGNPIQGANVTAAGHSVLTGADGSFSIELQPGTHTVTVSAEGYQGSTKTNILVNAGESITVPFELTPIQPARISEYVILAIVGIGIVGMAIYLYRRRKKTAQ